jgi:hypothetical protein
MGQSNLFFPEVQIKPATDFDEPAIWIKKLVLVENLERPINVIRKISFRRGLNIICTEERTPDDVHTVGHSVGKSLMVRIIRYCLGEEKYCTDTLRSSITNKLTHSYALAQIRVNYQTWNVARPLGLDSGFSCSWCTQADKLSSLMNEDARQKYRNFLDAIDEATKHCYEDIDLPVAERKAKWTDLLGWLSRDQDCHFAHHADWRITESQAGPRVLTREDAYLVMKMALGLLSPEETSLMNKHRELLQKKFEAEYNIQRYKNYIEETENQLRSTVNEVTDAIAGEVFGETLESIARQKIESFQRLIADPDLNKNEDIKVFRSSVDILIKEEGAIESRIKELQNSQICKKEELIQKENQDGNSLFDELLKLRWKCLYYLKKDEAVTAGCPGDKIKRQNIIDPARKQIIAEIQNELAAIAKEISLLKEKLKTIQAKSIKQKDILHDKLNEFIRHRDGIIRQIGLWEARSNQAQRYRTAWQNLDALEKSFEKHKKAVLGSSAQQSEYRAKMNKERDILSSYYSLVLKCAIDPDAQGEIIIDGNGIHPQPNEAVADSGTTLKTYADILSFDLACLTAAICGIGNMPRLWMHDSPRQADSEDELYHSILRFVRGIEDCYDNNQNINFQYILTTTSQPPVELNNKPYIRTTLHGRNDSGKLLKCTFGK